MTEKSGSLGGPLFFVLTETSKLRKREMRRMQMDEQRAVRALRDFLEAMDIDLTAENMERTPERVTRLYQKLFAGRGKDTASLWGETFAAETSGIAAVRDIPFYSMCEHHLVPFLGRVGIAYVPKDGRVAGFSKFAAVVDRLANRPQLQERLTAQIADAVYDDLEAAGVLVCVEARQLCMILHGDLPQETSTVTVESRGCLQHGLPAYTEAWMLLMKENT